MISRGLRMIKIWWVFLRFGLYDLAFMVPGLRHLRFLKPVLSLFNGYKTTPLPVRIRLALEQLGPTFIKLGQALSTRYDLLDKEIVDELVKLQDSVPPFPSDVAINIIEKAYQKPLNQIFRSFDETPIAAASIAQVHGAVLLNGQEVVVKVVRPGIQKVIKRDIGLMEVLAYTIERYYPDGKRLRPVEIVEEHARTILNELDLTIEAANGAQLRENFKGSRALYVPEIYLDYVRKNVFVMERISGVPVGDIETLKALGVDIPLLAKRSVDIFFTQVFEHSFFHADMHPGNIFVDVTNPKDPTYIALDFGIIGTLNEDDQHYLASNFLAFFNRDYLKVAELHVESGWVPPDTPVGDFEAVIRSLCEPVFNKLLKDISFGGFLLSLFQTARRFKMEMQPQLMLLQKTLFAIEGLGRELYPDLDLWETAKPYLVDFVKRKRGPKAIIKRYKHDLPIWLEQIPDMMQNGNIVFRQAVKGELKVNLAQTQWEQLQAIQSEESKRRILGGVGAVFLLALLLKWDDLSLWGTVSISLLGLFFFYLSLRKRR
ncbi:ubiquinone biosynthesis regulatory protein kinase UbiB [Ignatzschineria larvae DSM 13226]|uniref:Ubiquinone biosynthesis regulatory protein kinase UbiB n=1 Tax=Ignatzschineria larvae DSM 13226 TaxID=1111732 RepID=A0ABZ3C0H0_9GAMM|nr:ubiquinone biosynthesis regulatory protein kinase UbiB [Ignatzschineria larvae]